jgi:glycosyltransferase involved in cell wall biosynthesis
VEVTPLVSIISPCYNGEEYVGRMLDSILAQSHTNIEMICVDDGSTDKTVDIISLYSAKFAKKNMTLKLMRQDNQGQASAVNNALKVVNGDYLCWIDCDDFLTPDSVKLRLDALEQNPEYGVCSSDFYLVDESDLTEILHNTNLQWGHLNYQRDQFLLHLCVTTSGPPIKYMIRMSFFDQINPQREIDCCRYGQNTQMLLPMYYHFPSFYIDKPLAYYVTRKNSSCHTPRTPEELSARYDSFLVMLENVLKTLNLSDREIVRLKNSSRFMKIRKSHNF